MIVLFNKPFNVLCQFTDKEDRKTLSDFIPVKNIYAAGRLDYDSEGLVLLTDDGKLQHKILDPKHKLEKSYLVQVEGQIDQAAINKLKNGILLKDGLTKPAKVKIIDKPKINERNPPIRKRKNIPTSWIELKITEGKNRQVRRMTAAVGYPTLRLVRISIGQWNIDKLKPGEYKIINSP
ncbi:MAG: pseudouridine synthase [Ignavibacteriaceae bacterium]|jgi:23S rRNA pseudouridine2457 synthase|nr:pseudouridine synthase [Ignavibacteriaceae bacterium]